MLNYLILKGTFIAMLTTLCCCLAIAGTPAGQFMTWVSERPEKQELPRSIGVRLDRYEMLRRVNANPVPPFLKWTDAVRLDNGAVWAGSTGGLMYHQPGWPHWRLFHSRRWLPDNHVCRLAVVSKNEVWVETKAGLVRLVRRPETLQHKCEVIHSQLRQHHVRYGLVGSIQLKSAGTLDAGSQQPDSDNDGLWTALYIAAESYRFAVTGDPTARQNAWESMQALMFLEKITGAPGFVARSVVPISIDKEGQFPWEKSKDGKWWWKGDTSSDELDGHFFAYSVFYDLAATEEQKDQVRPVVQRIMDRLIDGNWYYRDPSGRVTTWGRWAPELLNRDPEWVAERGLNSLEILSYLKTTHHISGDARYDKAAQELIEKHGYAINTLRLKMTERVDPEVNHSDDELAFIAYYPMLRYERNPQLRAIYLLSLERSWIEERPEQSPFFNFIYAVCRQASDWPHPDHRPPKPFIVPGDYDRNLCLRWFQEIPSDLIQWTVINSTRRDLGRVYLNRHGELCTTRLLPLAERPVMRWNGDPFVLDGGAAGRSRDDGTFILLPYWMGRYHRLIQ